MRGFALRARGCETSGAREPKISRKYWTTFASPCRDLAIRRGGMVSTPGAHGAAARGTQKYINGPIQAGAVSRPARASTRPRVRAKRRSLDGIWPCLPLRAAIWQSVGAGGCRRPETAWGRTAWHAKVYKWSYTSVRGFALRARVCETSGARETKISQRYWTTFASPCRDLAIRRGGRVSTPRDRMGPHRVARKSI